jgi:molybdopterin-guanine dinucleotide biosynthesis protein A
VYVRKAGKPQPLYAIVRRDLLGSLNAYLAGGERKVMPWYESVGAVALDWDDAGVSFININTPEEYAAFLDL